MGLMGQTQQPLHSQTWRKAMREVVGDLRQDLLSSEHVEDSEIVRSMLWDQKSSLARGESGMMRNPFFDN
ncbi:hypothetical protein MRB53_006014 [Persea americana]|uniref:Uncharacterized protein n=1 Tax=Persea americana TaxID=3435 RepID=A0ACC2MF61_PERAE|nr:hypothetical protein MRB53_006014 [Persea americana]